MYTPSLTQRPELAIQKPAIKKGDSKHLVAAEFDQSTKSTPKLTVTIVAYNERELLLNLLEVLSSPANQQLARVLVVDNGLSKDIKKTLRKYPIHYVQTRENLGCTGGRNVAASYVETPLISFLDADASIEASYITDCLEAMADPTVVCARGKVIPLTLGSHVAESYDLGDESFAYYPSAEGISVWRTADFKKAGGFEADLYGSEGVVLCYRMIALMGYATDQFIYYPKLVLHHDYHKDTAHLKAKQLRNYINRWSVDRRYPMLQSLVKSYQLDTKQLRQRTIPEEKEPTITAAKQAFQTQLDTLSEAAMKQRWKTPDKKPRGGTYKFAVVIPCYKLGMYLETAIRSIMSQTLDSIQIIVVDDVSPDQATKDVLKRLESKVTVIYRQKNGGASAARNTGAKAAKADYILCLDADDSIEPYYLEEAYNVFEMYPEAGVVSCHVQLHGVRNGLWKPADGIGLPDALTSSPIPNASCFRKTAWQDAGGYDETMRGYEDWEFWLSILEADWKIRVIPRVHYRYLTRQDSKVHTSNKNAVNLISTIVSNHKNLYAQHVEYVVRKKQEQIVQLQEQATMLKEENQALRDHKTFGQKVWLAGKKTGGAAAEAISITMKTGSLKEGSNILSRKVHSANKLLKEQFTKPT